MAIKKTIDFAKLGGPVYIGRPKGEAAREKLNVGSIDKDENIAIDVVIPDNTYSINSSFFLGLFGDSIRAAGSREAFLTKYNFKCSPEIMKSVESGIQRALHEQTYLLPKKERK